MRDSDLIGRVAQAWRMARRPTRPDHEASLAQWLVISQPGAFHPLWNRWLVTVIHLRDIPGVASATRDSPEMTHEFMIMTVNPDIGPLDPDDPKPADQRIVLSPPDAVVQVQLDTDLQAIEVAELIARTVCNGLASPDSDYRTWWKSSIAMTAAHMRNGAPCTEQLRH